MTPNKKQKKSNSKMPKMLQISSGKKNISGTGWPNHLPFFITTQIRLNYDYLHCLLLGCVNTEDSKTIIIQKSLQPKTK